MGPIELSEVKISAPPSTFVRRLRTAARWWRLPFWILALVTGAKSFADNPIIGSRTLNAAGLHTWRLRAAHWLAWWRRSRLSQAIPAQQRHQFDRDGFVALPNFLPDDVFRRLQSTLLETELACREHRQGDTVTRRIPIGPDLLDKFPELAGVLNDPRWRGILAYVAGGRGTPLYYVQTIIGGCVEGPPDPQIHLHSDTFHPSMKAWLFLTDVGEADRPLTYVAGSHRLSPERLAWEHRKSVNVMAEGDRLSQRGSFRISPEELAQLGLPTPTRFAVPANTLVAVDTCGFHARATSDRPTVRVELWAYARRTPFLPFSLLDALAWGPLAIRRAQWLGPAVDWLARRRLMVQHWRPAGKRKPSEL